MSTALVRAALTAHLTAISPGAAVPDVSIAWEDKPFSPGSTRWYRATFLPGKPSAAAIGTEAANRVYGVFIVDVFDPSGSGTASADATAVEAERIAAAYKRGTVLTSGAQAVRMNRAYRSAGDNYDPKWHHVAAVIEWQADVAN